MPPLPWRQIVRSISLAILIVLMAVVGLVYWYAWRPLPQRSGAIEAGVSQTVSVAFDALGEPHIRAASQDDALFVQGYVTAQDRLWQMDGLRRLAGGDLAEILGPAFLESDRVARRLRLRRVAEADYLNLPAPDRAVLAAYARGVNAFLTTHRDRLPVEFTLLGYQPQPWSAVDSILVALHMIRTLTTTWREELVKRAMLQSGDPKKVNLLFAVRAGNEAQPGSNAWAVTGAHTASGKPLLANDIHLDYGLPGVWYMTHLEAPGLDVVGVALPGAPGVIVGHNQRIAWGITNLQFDVQDLYIEQLNEQTGQYLYRGHMEQARLERELIRVKGQPPVELLVWVTRHGPLFATEGGDRMALRWIAEDPSIFQYPVVEYDRAQNWSQFTTALARFPGPGSNFVYADTEGNIGYHVVGKLPKRRGYDGDVPVDGSSGDFDWDGYIPFDQLPSVLNPSRGIIVSSNQNPFPPDYPYRVNGDFAPARSKQVLDRLSAHDGWRADQMLAIQTDVYSRPLQFLASQAVTAYGKRNSRDSDLDLAVGLLREWNGQMDKDLAAPFLATLLYQQVRKAVAMSASPQSGAAYDYRLAPNIVEQLLRQRPAGWFRNYDEMLVKALGDAVEEGRRNQGRDLRRWRYGAYWKVTINHPVLHQIPLLGRYFDIGTVSMSGSATTVKQTTRQLAPSMRMDVDLSNWERSLLNVQIGQSGQIFSRHYKDQWEDYYNGRSYPMQFGAVQATSTLEFRPAAESPAP